MMELFSKVFREKGKNQVARQQEVDPNKGNRRSPSPIGRAETPKVVVSSLAYGARRSPGRYERQSRSMNARKGDRHDREGGPGVVNEKNDDAADHSSGGEGQW